MKVILVDKDGNVLDDYEFENREEYEDSQRRAWTALHVMRSLKAGKDAQ